VFFSGEGGASREFGGSKRKGRKRKKVKRSEISRICLKLKGELNISTKGAFRPFESFGGNYLCSGGEVLPLKFSLSDR